MSELEVADILKLSVEERLRLVDLIWESLAANPNSVPMGAAHLEIIEDRLAEHRRDANSTITLEEVLTEAHKAS